MSRSTVGVTCREGVSRGVAGRLRCCVAEGVAVGVEVARDLVPGTAVADGVGVTAQLVGVEVGPGTDDPTSTLDLVCRGVGGTAAVSTFVMNRASLGKTGAGSGTTLVMNRASLSSV